MVSKEEEENKWSGLSNKPVWRQTKALFKDKSYVFEPKKRTKVCHIFVILQSNWVCVDKIILHTPTLFIKDISHF
jgi:hypothetical protein